ncbi:hypothetical protein EON79_11675 [bacterium]|nr:MAG: hypothetical protein EON79_11675 [bacterium]
MAQWNEVSSLEDLERFLDRVVSFHDGIVKEVHWVNRDHIDASLAMSPYRLADARMLVQRQGGDPSAVELYFERIWRCDLNTVDFIFESKAATVTSVDSLGPTISLLRLDLESTTLAFERMFWRETSDWMGSDVRFGPFTSPIRE